MGRYPTGGEGGVSGVGLARWSRWSFLLWFLGSLELENMGGDFFGDFVNNRYGTVTRTASIAKARLSFNAALPREGRIARQCRRCLLINDGVATMRELRSWAYPGQPRQHWHHTNIRRALKRLGAQRIGWGVYAQPNRSKITSPLPSRCQTKKTAEIPNDINAS